MPALDWTAFSSLPGATTHNFELLCRALVRRHYGAFGNFVELANQPGVEFHLKLHSACSLGGPGTWLGWQCRWFDLPRARAMGNARQRKIQGAIATTEAELPELTDWILWTRYPLTKGDHKWFESIETSMRLHEWTGAEVDEHLSGPAEFLRATYFGELILTRDELDRLHGSAVAAVQHRWLPDVHQTLEAERLVRRALGRGKDWEAFQALGECLVTGASAISGVVNGLPAREMAEVGELVERARALARLAAEVRAMLEKGDLEIVAQLLESIGSAERRWGTLVRRLRALRHPAVLPATNACADMHALYDELAELRDALALRLVAVVAGAGYGKTQLAAQLTAPSEGRVAGLLLHGRNLAARESLADFAREVVIQGKPVPSFEAVIVAMNGAGERASRRLPLVIDGLNEAEDPRDWRTRLASLQESLLQFPYVLVVVTLRPSFVQEALPEGTPLLALPGFQEDVAGAVQKYFRHYKIDASDAELPRGLLEHPLTLRMFCEVTNPERNRIVGIEAMPLSLTALFDRYLEQVAERVSQLAQRTWRYYESDVRSALSKIGLFLWERRRRSINLDDLRSLLQDQGKSWDQSIVRALEHDGVLFRTTGKGQETQSYAIVHDALAGHLVADALLGQFGGESFESWLADGGAEGLAGDSDSRHPLGEDILRGLVGLFPRRLHRRQLWSLLEEPLRRRALYECSKLEGKYLDGKTVSELASLLAQADGLSRRLLRRLRSTRAARSHPLDATFLDSLLRPMAVADRDLFWAEWLRSDQDRAIEDLKRLEERWKSEVELGKGDRLGARWVMWTLTSTVRLLRDHATRALYWFGCEDPEGLFGLVLESLGINDPYVPERMLAATYGVCMALWAEPGARGARLRVALSDFGPALLEDMFTPGARHASRHVLLRDYAQGVVALALKVSPSGISDRQKTYLQPPTEHTFWPFPSPAEIDASVLERVKGAIQMDFGNYTIGRLVPDRWNYDFDNQSYQEIRRQIEWRIVDLGYSEERFRGVDGTIAQEEWAPVWRRPTKIDRYGKKYS